MDGIKRLVTFGIGGAVGAFVGVVVGSLMAPQSGKTLQQSAHNFVEEVKTAGDVGQAQAEAAFRARFQARVGDSTALTGVVSKG